MGVNPLAHGLGVQTNGLASLNYCAALRHQGGQICIVRIRHTFRPAGLLFVLLERRSRLITDSLRCCESVQLFSRVIAFVDSV